MDEINGPNISEGLALANQVIDSIIHEYGYQAEQIGIEVILQKNPQLRADLVVFDSPKKEKPFIIFELKSNIRYSTIVDYQIQLTSYLISSGAKYAVLTNGKSRICYTLDGSVLLEIPDIPKRNESLSPLSRGQLKAPLNLEYKLWKISDLIRGSLSSLEYFNEISKIILCKLVDEKQRGPIRYVVTANELSNIQEESTQRDVTERMNQLFEAVKREYPALFNKNERIKLDASTLSAVLLELQPYSFSGMPDKAVENLFDHFNKLNNRASMGQYSTPELISQFIVEMLDPKANETVLDLACGSGAFVVKTLRYLMNRREFPLQKLGSHNIYGLDISRNIVIAAKMNVLLHNGDYSKILLADSLKSPLPQAIQSVIADKGGFDVIVCDPPLSGRIEKQEAYTNYLLFDKKRVVRSESLFIERGLQLLKPGGRMAIIVAEGLLFSEPNIKSILLKKGQLKAVIGLPSFAYSSQGLNIKTSILIIKKPIANFETKDNTVFMAAINNEGMTKENSDFGFELNRITKEYLKFDGSGLMTDIDRPRIFSTKVLDNNWTINHNDPRLSKQLKDELSESATALGSKVLALEQLASVVKGAYVSSKHYVTVNTVRSLPYIRIGDLREGKINHLNVKYIQIPSSKKISQDSTAREGDILFSVEGTLGKTAIVDKTINGVASAGIAIIRIISPSISRNYLHLVLNSDTVKRQIERANTGSIIPHLSLKDVRHIKIPVPSMQEQERIVNNVMELKRQVATLTEEKDEIQSKISRLLEGQA